MSTMDLHALKGFEPLDEGSVPDTFWSPSGGGVAFGGALRLFPFRAREGLPSFDEWNARDGWRSSYGELAPQWDSVGEDAFGTQYLISPGLQPKVALFWAETAEIEELGVGPSEFLEMIAEDPEGTVSLSLYEACVARFGSLPLNAHFALRVEAALGGEMTAENVVPMPAREHMAALAHIARQVKDVPIGTVFTDVKLAERP
jgi:hypothetical protein